MAATMNMFEYYHYMTLFIDELVDKHGYDREVLVNTWRSQNAKFMQMEEEKAAVPKKGKGKASKTDAAVESGTESATEEKPVKKGKGKAAKTEVTESAVEEKPKKSKGKKAAKAEATEETTKCSHVPKTGKNKGVQCTHDVLPGTDKCKTHTPKSKTSSEEVHPTEEKPAEQPAEHTEEEKPEEEKPAEHTEEKPTEQHTEEKHQCTVELKSGKNKGKTCPHDALPGTDKCKTHTKSE